MSDKKANIIMFLTLVVAPLILLVNIRITAMTTKSVFNEAKENNNTAAATVEKTRKSSPAHPGTDTVTVSYQVDGEEYSTTVLAVSGSLKEGDTVTVYYYARNPVLAYTEENIDLEMKAKKTQTIIFGIVFAVMFLVWFFVIAFPQIKKYRSKKKYDKLIKEYYSNNAVAKGSKTSNTSNGHDTVFTPYGTITRNPNYRGNSGSQKNAGSNKNSKKRKK